MIHPDDTSMTSLIVVDHLSMEMALELHVVNGSSCIAPPSKNLGLETKHNSGRDRIIATTTAVLTKTEVPDLNTEEYFFYSSSPAASPELS
jgi:hypothetical protein